MFGPRHAAPSPQIVPADFEGIALFMWRLKKVVDRNWVTLCMSGHLEAKHLAEIQNSLANEGTEEKVFLDLSEVTVIAQEVVRFLANFEVNRIDLDKCPTYLRDWITQERRAMRRHAPSESK